MGQTQTVFLPPWEPTTEAEKERADEKAENSATVDEAKAGLEAVEMAIDILDKFYKTAANRAKKILRLFCRALSMTCRTPASMPVRHMEVPRAPRAASAACST